MRKYLGLCLVAGLAVAVGGLSGTGQAQDRLPSMPGYQEYQKNKGLAKGSVKSGDLEVTWKANSKAFEYDWDGKRYRFDIAAGQAVAIGPATGEGSGKAKGKKGKGGDEVLDDDATAEMDPALDMSGPQKVQRGRQAASEMSPDGRIKAFYRDCNLWLSNTASKAEMQITKDGNEKGRVKYATGSWVYGEELAQKTAMWWSPDSKKVAFYRFDESKVRDYYLPLNQSSLYPKIDAEPYPKPGAPNPMAEVFVYDLNTWKTTQIDVRDGKPFENDVVGHYVYAITWSPDGKELLMHRTNRRQNILELVAADPATGKCRVIVHDEWLPSWVANRPAMRYLKDKTRFIWTSESTGFKNFHLYTLESKKVTNQTDLVELKKGHIQRLAKITDHPFEVANIVRLDEEAGLLYYTARSGDNHMKMQLHRISLNSKGEGTGDKRLTDPAFHHSVDLAPDGKHFIDIIQTHDTPPVTRLCDAEGKVIAELAKSDTSVFDKRGLKRVELITYKAGDGVTDLHGMLSFPSKFDPTKKYPLLVTVYGGPNTNKASENFALPSAMTEYGFLVAGLDSRSASGRGKEFIDAIYMKLGVTEIDDQAAGVKSLWNRPYLDKNRVGIFGTSYGGYASAMCILRHPDVFQAASASSPVTDWSHYDSIYTERYMGIPQENRAGYKAGSAMTYAGKLKGRLMLFYGTQDNNVHPSNTLALVSALQDAGKGFEVQVGPDQGHSGLGQPRMMEFFIENLVIRPGAVAAGR